MEFYFYGDEERRAQFVKIHPVSLILKDSISCLSFVALLQSSSSCVVTFSTSGKYESNDINNTTMVNYDARLKYLAFIPCAMGPLSILGSVLILLTLYRTKKILGSKAIHTYHRLLCGIAVFDIILSIAATMGTLMMPAELGIPGAHGNTGTCTFQGFLYQMGIGSFSYSASLMVYYVLVLRFNVSSAKMVKYFEPWLHAIPLIFHFTTGILGLFWEVYNPSGIRCWVGTYPPGCEYSQDDELDCERGGKHSEVFGLWLTTYATMFVTGIIIICLIIVISTVLQQHYASRQHVYPGSAPNRAQQDRVRLVVSQCLLYGIFFLNVVLWGVAATLMELAGETFDALGDDFWLASIASTLFPIEGFFYFLIYIRPRYLSLRQRSNNSSLGRWQALKISIWEPENVAAGALTNNVLPKSQKTFSELVNVKKSKPQEGVSSDVTRDRDQDAAVVESAIDDTEAVDQERD